MPFFSVPFSKLIVVTKPIPVVFKTLPFQRYKNLISKVKKSQLFGPFGAAFIHEETGTFVKHIIPFPDTISLTESLHHTKYSNKKAQSANIIWVFPLGKEIFLALLRSKLDEVVPLVAEPPCRVTEEHII